MIPAPRKPKLARALSDGSGSFLQARCHPLGIATFRTKKAAKSFAGPTTNYKPVKIAITFKVVK